MDVDDKGAKAGRGRDRASVPVLRKAKGDKKQLHTVQPMRDELVGGAGHLQASAHKDHAVYVAGSGHYCTTCKVYF